MNKSDIINLLQQHDIYQAKKIFFETIKTLDDMNRLILYTFENNKDTYGKMIIDFKFPIKRKEHNSDYSPFDFFCYVCKNDYSMILFRIIEDSYFWQKNNVIFEQEYEQTPLQWLISTSAYICCTFNKVNTLEKLCDKYNITYFDATQIGIFEIAKKNNGELTRFVNQRFLISDYSVIETSLYTIPVLVAENPMYMQINEKPNELTK